MKKSNFLKIFIRNLILISVVFGINISNIDYAQNRGNPIENSIYIKEGFTSNHLNKEQNKIQYIDLNNIDPMPYANMYNTNNPIYFSVGGTYGWNLLMGDYNNNGKTDITGYNYNDSSNLGYGKAVMAEYEINEVEKFPIKFYFPDTTIIPLGIVDINKDSMLDFLTLGNMKGRDYSLNCFTSTSSGKYPDSLMFFDYLLPGVDINLSSGNFDKDSLTDLVLYSSPTAVGIEYPSVVFCEFDIDSNKLVRRNIIPIPGYNEISEFAIADFDNDGYIEFIGGSAPGIIYGFENRENNAYELFYMDTLDIFNCHIARSTSDLDNNGKPEAFILGMFWEQAKLFWLESDGGHSFNIVREVIFDGMSMFQPNNLYIYDINLDGQEDLAFNFTNKICVLNWNNNNKEFEIIYFYNASQFYEVQNITIYDLENDLTPDLFISFFDYLQNEKYQTIYCENKFLQPNEVFNEKSTLSFFLEQNYPNPFNPSTKISWQSPVSSWQTLKVFDVLGNEVATLVNEYRSAGSYEIEFDPASSIKNPASGIYFYQLKVGDPSTGSGQSFVETKKMLLLK